MNTTKETNMTTTESHEDRPGRTKAIGGMTMQVLMTMTLEDALEFLVSRRDEDAMLEEAENAVH